MPACTAIIHLLWRALRSQPRGLRLAGRHGDSLSYVCSQDSWMPITGTSRTFACSAYIHASRVATTATADSTGLPVMVARSGESLSFMMRPASQRSEVSLPASKSEPPTE